MNSSFRGLVLLLFIGLIGFASTPAHAQIGDVGSILQAGKDDANALARAYLKPFGSGFGASLNTGWTNTAQPHKTLGFDITVGSGLAIVPNADKTFDVTELGLQELVLDPQNQDPISQTINGSSEMGPTLAAFAEGPQGQQQKILEFTMPEGSGFGYVPAPVFKAGIGIIKDTELMVRYTPEIQISDFGTFDLFGVGAKHGLNQWLPGGKLLPVNLSLMFGYTNMEVGSDFNITPDEVIQDPGNTENPYGASTWDGQRIALKTDAWSINALVGKSLPVISVYGGVGYEASTFSVTTPGNYPTVIPNEDYQTDPNNNEPFIVNAVEEPIDISIDGDNGFRALAGFRLRFTVFHISGSYTLSNYSSYNLGVGISF